MSRSFLAFAHRRRNTLSRNPGKTHGSPPNPSIRCVSAPMDGLSALPWTARWCQGTLPCAYTAAESEKTEVLLEEGTNAEAYVDVLRSPIGACSRVCSKGGEAGSRRYRNDDLPRNLLRDSRSRQNDDSCIQRWDRTTGASRGSRWPHFYGARHCSNDCEEIGQRTCGAGASVFGQSCRWC